MSEALFNQEPNPHAPFCRRLGVELPEYRFLDEIRGEMDIVEPQLIDAIAEQKAGLDSILSHKNDLHQNTFVDQYEINAARIVEQAAAINPGLAGFEELVASLYLYMVPTSLSINYDISRDPAVEMRVISLIGERCRLVRQAAFFKQDLGESSAPARQARNIANARNIASQYTNKIPDFENHIEDIYSKLVPGSVELQHAFWEQTIRVRNPDNARRLDKLFKITPEIWNMGEFDDTADPRVVPQAH